MIDDETMKNKNEAMFIGPSGYALPLRKGNLL